MQDLAEKDIDQLDELQEIDGSEEMYEHFAITVDKDRRCCVLTSSL